MADVLPSVSEADIFTALRAFILTVVVVEVVRTQGNRVPMPLGDFIALTPKTAVPLETNTDSYTATTKTVERRTQYTIQVDCYGQLASDRALTIATLLRDSYAVDQFAALGFDVTPLYAGDATQMPLIDGEEQYEQRWTFDAVLQVNATITLPESTADTLTVGLVPADVFYQ